ncbi:MAG: DUF262 domain-containing protein [Acidobacteriota bacterium]
MNPIATNHPISHFRKYYDDDHLDLSPTFQRKAVWSKAQSSYLIDSILNDLPIPEIFVRSVTDPGGATTLEVVDGQQRLRAIIQFYQGDLELSGSDVTPSLEGTSWNDLSSAAKKKFWAYKLVTRELESASDAEVRDMFRRLNANQSNLNAQELRHAEYRGEFIAAVEGLADNPWWLERRIVTPAQVRRMIDAEFISELLVGLMAGPLDKKGRLDDYYQEYDDEFADRDYWLQLMEETRLQVDSFLRGDFSGWRSKTEFYTLFLAVGALVYEGTSFGKRRLGEARERLAVFREKVDRAKRKGPTPRLAKKVLSYADAATRASTDLSRRELRIRILREVILGD